MRETTATALTTRLALKSKSLHGSVKTKYDHIIRQSCKPPYGDLWNKWYNNRCRHSKSTLQSDDIIVVITIWPCPMVEDIALPQVYNGHLLKGTFLEGLPCWIRHRIGSFWSKNKQAILQKLACEATFLPIFKRQLEQWIYQTVFCPLAGISHHQVGSRIGDDVTWRKCRLQAGDGKQHRRATLEDLLQLLTYRNDVRVQIEQNYYCRQRNPQMTPCIVDGRGQSTAEKLAAEGSPADASAIKVHCPTVQDVIVMKKHMNTEPPDILSTEDITVALCAKKESEEEIRQALPTDRVENVNSGTTDTFS